MTVFYNLVDRNNHEYLGSFLTSLSKDRLKELECKAEKMYQSESGVDKTAVFYEMISKRPRKGTMSFSSAWTNSSGKQRRKNDQTAY